MELFETMLIALQLTNILAKKKYKIASSSSEESIENILYYTDCNHKRRNAEPVNLQQPIPPPPPPKQQECKMCCSMCCGDNCINNHCTDGTSRQGPIMKGRSGVGSMPKPVPRQPDGPMQPIRMRKKKFKQPLLPPIGSRRDFGFTRENIKNLISQDDDIKKILKDLVKVTMQKVDLVEMINARRGQMEGSENLQDGSNNDEEE
ncbi:uncharacterized protein [Epargyreus clarus]|uniref:uncharacterized protein n=1 Tax=Epargyreus clarus TaxID=520877 RepID=UPI003C2F44B5